MKREPFIFGKAWVHTQDLIYFYGATRAMNGMDEMESVVLRWHKGQWSLWQVPTRLCGIVTTERAGVKSIFCIGFDGYVEVSKGERVYCESIDDSEDGPDHLRHVTHAYAFGEYIYALGMSRMIYERSPLQDFWHRSDQGVRVPLGDKEIDGLKAIDRGPFGELVVVGLRGGIWVLRDGIWRNADSPTNVKLEAVRWMDDVLYVAGGGGLLLRGTVDALQPVPHSAGRQTFWSMSNYQGELYLATRDNMLWKLNGDDLERVNLPGGAGVTTGWLHSSDGILVSVGERDICVLDGLCWSRLDPPADDVNWPFEWG